VQAIAASGPISAVAAPSAKPATDRLQHCGTHPALGDHRVETGAVVFLLRGHAGNLGRMRCARAHHCQLPAIDTGGAVFTGLIDAQHPLAS
jgi:hypothetical protein